MGRPDTKIIGISTYANRCLVGPVFDTNEKDPNPTIYQCSGPDCSCGQQFSTLYEYEVHAFNAQPVSEIYYCPRCDYTASTRTRVRYHLVHHFPGIYTAQCSDCSKLCKNIKDLTRHRRVVHRKLPGARSRSQNPYPASAPIARPRSPTPPRSSRPLTSPINLASVPIAPLVQPTSMNPQALERYNQTLAYFRSLPNAPEHKCPKCCYTSRIRKHVEMHLIVHFKDVYPYPCSYCPSLFKHIAGFRKHNWDVHGARVSLLESKPLNSSATTTTMIKPPPAPKPTEPEPLAPRLTPNPIHVPKPSKLFSCNLSPSCSQLNFKSDFYYKSHLLSHQTPINGLYKCSQCYYTNGKLKIVRFHFVKHFDIQPYECKWCDAKFKFKESLRKHKLRLHPELMPPGSSSSTSPSNFVQVEYGNGNGPSDPSANLSMSMSRYRDEEKIEVAEIQEPSASAQCKFTCIRRNCFAVFDNELEFRYHEALHLPENLSEYPCSDCSKICYSNTSYEQHILSHYTNSPIQCNSCNFFTQNKELFRSHKLEAHCTTNTNEIFETEVVEADKEEENRNEVVDNHGSSSRTHSYNN